MQDNHEEKKKAILKTEQMAVQQAKQEREAIISEARQLEEEMCRNMMEAGERLKKELKQVNDPAEKAALKTALKETQSSGRQTISRAKKNAETQVRIALQQEKACIQKARADKEQALQELKRQTSAIPVKMDQPESLPEADDSSPPAVFPGKEDRNLTGTRIEKEEQPEAPAHGEQYPVESVEDTIEVSDNVREEPGVDAGKYSGYEDILRSLEQLGRKLEESRQARSDLNIIPAENDTVTKNYRVRSPAESEEAPAGAFDTGIIEPAQSEQTVHEETATAGNAPDAPVNQPEAEKAGLFEGRVRIIMQNPSSAAVKALGENLKKIDDVKMLLFCGSADEGVQIIVMVLKPIPLVERIEQTGQVEIVSSTLNEITLRFKT